jgi:hypothetical protein
MDSTLQTLSQSLGHWQAVYIVSIVVALLSTFAIVIFAFHIQEHKFALKVSNYLYVIASLLAVVATIIIVNKTRSIDAEKDREIKIATNAANLKIAQADTDAANANQKAEEAKKANLQLQIELDKHEEKEKKTEAQLAAQNQQTAQFVQGVAQQQQGMAQQMQVTPSLNDTQVDFIGNQLRIYSGQNIQIHVLSDPRSARLGNQFGAAFQKAGITVNGSGTFFGPDYHGVMVIVRNATPGPHPALADVLINVIRAVGIMPHPAADPNGPKENEVWLCIGPE